MKRAGLTLVATLALVALGACNHYSRTYVSESDLAPGSSSDPIAISAMVVDAKAVTGSGSNDLIITLANGDEITLNRQADNSITEVRLNDKRASDFVYDAHSLAFVSGTDGIALSHDMVELAAKNYGGADLANVLSRVPSSTIGQTTIGNIDFGYSAIDATRGDLTGIHGKGGQLTIRNNYSVTGSFGAASLTGTLSGVNINGTAKLNNVDGVASGVAGVDGLQPVTAGNFSGKGGDFAYAGWWSNSTE